MQRMTHVTHASARRCVCASPTRPTSAEQPLSPARDQTSSSPASFTSELLLFSSLQCNTGVRERGAEGGV